MNELNVCTKAMLTTTQEETSMSSLDFLNDYINPARLECGEKAIRYQIFLRRISDELDDLGEMHFSRNINGVCKVLRYYYLSLDQMILVGMRESKGVRKRVLLSLKKLNMKH